jgi:hypothetical protein
MLDTWQEIARFEATERLRQDLNEALDKGHHHCPQCGHSWPIEADHIASLERQIAIGPDTRPTTPALDPAGIRLELHLIDDHPRTLSERRRLEEFGEAKEPSLSRAEIARALASWERAAERESLEFELLELEARLAPMPDYQQRLSQRLAIEAVLGAYRTQFRDYQHWIAQRAEAQLRLREIEPLRAPDLLQGRSPCVARL